MSETYSLILNSQNGTNKLSGGSLTTYYQYYVNWDSVLPKKYQNFNVSFTLKSVNTATQITTFSMPVGTYIVYWSGLCTSASTYYTMSLNLGSPTITQKNSCAVLCNNAAVSNANPKINMSAIVQNSNTEQWYLSHQASVIGTNYVSNVFLYYVRIA